MAEGGIELDDLNKENKGFEEEEETDLGGGDDSSRFHHFNRTIEDGDTIQDSSQLKLEQKEKEMDEAADFIKTVYKKVKFNKFLIEIREYNQVGVKLKDSGAKWFQITKDGIQGNPGKKLLNFLGKKTVYEEVVNEEEVVKEKNAMDKTFNDLILEIDAYKKIIDKHKKVIESQNNKLEANENENGRLKKQVKIGEDRLNDYNKVQKNY